MNEMLVSDCVISHRNSRTRAQDVKWSSASRNWSEKKKSRLDLIEREIGKIGLHKETPSTDLDSFIRNKHQILMRSHQLWIRKFQFSSAHTFDFWLLCRRFMVLVIDIVRLRKHKQIDVFMYGGNLLCPVKTVKHWLSGGQIAGVRRFGRHWASNC